MNILRTRAARENQYFGTFSTALHANTVRDDPMMLFYEKTSDNFKHFYFIFSSKNPTTIECHAFKKKSCQKLITQEGSVRAKQIICESERPVTSTK